MKPALLITTGAILCWALLSVVSRILLLAYDLDPWMFSFLQLFAGGVALLILSGKGGLDLTSFVRPSTWVLGALRVLSAALYTAVLVWVSVPEAGIFGALNLPVVAIIVWIVMGQRPARFEWVGHGLALGAVVMLALQLEPGFRTTVLGLMGLNALCLAGMSLLVEAHPDNRSDLPGARTRFTGAVLLVTAIVFLAARIVQTGSVDGRVDMTLILSSVAVGIFLRAPAMLLAFWSIRLAGTQNYTAAISLLPVFGLVFEQLAVALGLIETSRFQIGTVYLLGLVLLGTFLILFARSLRLRASTNHRTET
ncbi:hypothetical protein E2K80_13145 [Rhodophyticola sp. CCM32]|uniref:EamA family transporter n=1 Tax=Rhodophyticola sp. CCM32 TaxID=2916397 RepID=UPI00107FD093|nr:EamA family transporter [Rhodophyticola sp. CCM32]QBY01552.1 hypothetical protein E2K80_13145 [Rhodophyticola sp. CCM32]